MKHRAFPTTPAPLPLATCEKSKEAPAGMDALHAEILRGNDVLSARGGKPLLANAGGRVAAGNPAPPPG